MGARIAMLRLGDEPKEQTTGLGFTKGHVDPRAAGASNRAAQCASAIRLSSGPITPSNGQDQAFALGKSVGSP